MKTTIACSSLSISLALAGAMCATPASAQVVGRLQAAPVQAPAPAVRVPGFTVQVPPVVVPPFDELKMRALEESLRSLGPSLDALKTMDSLKLQLDTFRLADDAAQDAMTAREIEKAFAQSRAVLAQRETPFYVDVARDGLYDAGLSSIDSEQYQRAIDLFDRVIKAGKSRVDGALYWKAYAQDKLGQRNEALGTLQELQKSYPNSRWLSDAKALEIEVKQNAGQPVKPEDHVDEDLKLLAINSLMQSDPERGIPMLQQVLKGRNSLKVKERALFVLAQSKSPQAKDVLVQVARGGGNPDLQMKAIRYLGIYGKSDTQVLADIYTSSSDADVKREILRTLMSASDTDRLIHIAKTEQSPELRMEAIRYLGSLTRTRQVMVEFQTRALAAEKAAATAQGRTLVTPSIVLPNAKPKVDAAAVSNALVQIYKSEKDPAIKKQIVSSLASEQNAGLLVSLARAETDPMLKKDIVARLANMKAKEATDYMLEILK